MCWWQGQGRGIERCAGGRGRDEGLRGVLAAGGWGRGIERCAGSRGMGTRD